MSAMILHSYKLGAVEAHQLSLLAVKDGCSRAEKFRRLIREAAMKELDISTEHDTPSGSETARLTTALRQAEAERNAAHNLLADRVIAYRHVEDECGSYRHQVLMFIKTSGDLEQQRDAAQADAERLAGDLKDAAEKIHYWNNHEGTFKHCERSICDEFSKTLAAHAAVTGKAVTK